MKPKRKILTILSFGGGQDSTALLELYFRDNAFRERYAPGRFLVVMSDTGDEHPHTREHVERIRRRCRENGVEFHLLTPDLGFHVPSWPDLITPQTRKPGGKYKTTLCQLGTKTCTLQLKIGPIYKFLDEWININYGYGLKVRKGRGCGKKAIKRLAADGGEIRVLIGFAAGEESRAEKSRRREARDAEGKSFWRHIRREFPLIDLGMDREACQKYLDETTGFVPYPSNCMRCPYQSPEELLWLKVHYPKEFQEWVEIEAAKIERFSNLGKKNHGVKNSKTLLPEIVAKAAAKYASLSPEDLERFLDQHKRNHGCGGGSY